MAHANADATNLLDRLVVYYNGLMITDTMTERFWSRVDKTEGCWNWTGGLDTGGYGALRIPAKRTSSKKVRVSRYSWELHNGPITNNLFVLHSCDNTKCVNPSHLFLGTQSDNMLDMSMKKRHPMGSKTHCVNGHLLEGNNLYSYGPEKRWRGCRTCIANNGKRYEASKRIAKNEFVG